MTIFRSQNTRIYVAEAIPNISFRKPGFAFSRTCLTVGFCPALLPRCLSRICCVNSTWACSVVSQGTKSCNVTTISNFSISPPQQMESKRDHLLRFFAPGQNPSPVSRAVQAAQTRRRPGVRSGNFWRKSEDSQNYSFSPKNIYL